MKRLLPILMVFGVFLGSAGEGFALPECEGSPTEDQRVSVHWDGCKGTRIYSDGNKYSGEYKSGRPDGRGTLIDGQGFQFDGKFISGYLEGKVTITKPDGCVLTGNFKESKVVGKYKMVRPGVHLPRCSKATPWGEKCFGSWQNDYGDTYIGEFKIKNGRMVFWGEGIYTCNDNADPVYNCRLFSDRKSRCGIWEEFEYLGTKKEYEQILARKRAAQKQEEERKEAERREEERKAVLRREEQEKAAAEAKKPDNILESRYVQYITIKECNKISSRYINSGQMKTAKSKIKSIQDHLKNKNKKMDTDAVWESASKKWDKEMGGSFKLFAMIGQYSKDLNGICRLQLMGLSSVRIPGAKKKARKKDF